MKRIIVLSAVALMSLWLYSCGGSKKDMGGAHSTSSEKVKMDSVTSAVPMEESETANEEVQTKKTETIPVSSSAARLGKIDSIRKIMRTADLKFKVDNVVKTSYTIEDIIAHFGGFISSSEIRNEINRTEKVPFSDDSAIKNTYYTINCEIVARVPAANLDSTLKAIAPLVGMIDYRIVKATDLTLYYLKQDLENKRQARYQQRVSKVSDTKGSVAGDRLEAEDRILQSQETSDEALIRRFETEDKIAYSQINISMYQDEMIRVEKVAEQNKGGFFKAGFGYRMLQAFQNGWNVIRFLIYFAITIWPLILIGAIVWITIIYYRRKKNNK